jgi:hypothetical protein
MDHYAIALHSAFKKIQTSRGRAAGTFPIRRVSGAVAGTSEFFFRARPMSGTTKMGGKSPTELGSGRTILDDLHDLFRYRLTQSIQLLYNHGSLNRGGERSEITRGPHIRRFHIVVFAAG